MSSYAGQDLFASGPHSFRVGSWPRDVQRRPLAGTDGELLLDLGRRARPIVQTGRLQAATAAGVTALLEAICALADGRLHDLVDNHGNAYSRVLLGKLIPATPVQRGRGFFCDYEIHYLQLP